MTTKSNLPLTIGHYLKNMPLLADNWNGFNYKDPDRQRIYLKDIDCPKEWHDSLKQLIPPPLFYLNEGPGPFKGPGSASRKKAPAPTTKTGAPIAKAGDLMSSLPPNLQAENLMCYIGHEGTYTPSHQEMCASLGHNIMVEASDGAVEHGKSTSPGSSIWFMTETKDRHTVGDYWTSTLGHHIDIEDHFAQVNAWRAAPFTTYVVEQKPGDFILIPPLAAHQVWNRGTRTMKVAWNRTTAETLEMALEEGLSRARMVCRDEQYKNKAIIFYSLCRYSKLLSQVNTPIQHPKVEQLKNDFQHLFSLYTRILLSESFSQELPEEKDLEFVPFDGSVTCSYCRCNIFNRFLTCPWCIEGKDTEEENAYDICMDCYAMGRSCACISRLKWAEQFRWSDLTAKHETWRQQVLQQTSQIQGHQPLDVERTLMEKRSLAEICQGQLKMRPWVDITQPDEDEKKDNGHASDEDAAPAPKRKKIGRGDQADDDHRRCHVCMYYEPMWKLASCSYCPRSYCFGSLFRAFNLQPQAVLEQIRWMCPKCQKICNCGACRKNPNMQPFQPACMLGHDTKKIADPRSTEALVDFRHSNLRWLQKAADIDAPPAPQTPKRSKPKAKGKKREREPEKNGQPLDNYAAQVEEPLVPDEHDYSIGYEQIPIDPALEQMDSSLFVSPDATSQSALQDIARSALG